MIPLAPDVLAVYDRIDSAFAALGRRLMVLGMLAASKDLPVMRLERPSLRAFKSLLHPDRLAGVPYCELSAIKAHFVELTRRDVDNILRCRMKHAVGRGIATVLGFAVLVTAFTLGVRPSGVGMVCFTATIAFALVVVRSLLVTSIGAEIDADEKAISSMADEAAAAIRAAKR